MPRPQIVKLQEDNDLRKIKDLIFRNYKLFIFCLFISLALAFLFNKFTSPKYKISSSILIREESKSSQMRSDADYMNSNIFGGGRNFQNELWILKSSPIVEQTIRELDLFTTYYREDGIKSNESYDDLPFQVLLVPNHIQPVNVKFKISIHDNNNFTIKAKEKDVTFKYLDSNNDETIRKNEWTYSQKGKFGKIIETDELAFIVQINHEKKGSFYYKDDFAYAFDLSDISSLSNKLRKQIAFNVVQKDATIIEITYKSSSVRKGKNVVNHIMNEYSRQNLDRKNHLARITIDYIDKQLSDISDSLSRTESSLQTFRSSNQLLNVDVQTSGLTQQYNELQNQLAELTTRKRYYDYVAEYLSTKEDYTDIIIPSSMGIQDQMLSDLMSKLVSAHAQRASLIQNNQEKSPIIHKLNIQIDNTRKTISENVNAVQKSTDISIDEMNKRVRKIEVDISTLPKTQRLLGGIERKYKLNDAIYSYLLQKRAEAKITQASNLPDNQIIESARMVGTNPVSPNVILNYLVALFFGLALPFGFLTVQSGFSNKIESQENIEEITDAPILGKILHNDKKTNNVMLEFPKSSLAESFRALRTNLEYLYRNNPRKIILVTSSVEWEGKSFNALNIAMSFAQLNRKTILVDFDMHKPTSYFADEEGSLVGLSTYYMERISLREIISHSPNKNLDYIPSGPLPPNPTELIALGETFELFDQLKEQYECIVIDSTPLAQVSDGYLLMEYADIKVLLTRYNYSLKKVFSFIIKDLKQKNINDICIVLNDNRIYRDQYGYTYGYQNKKKRLKIFGFLHAGSHSK